MHASALLSLLFLAIAAIAIPLHDDISVPEADSSTGTRRAETYDFTTCGQQGGCLEVSVVQNSPAALCNTGKCDYRVCVSIKPNCGKAGTMQYSCKKPEDQCTATSGFGVGFAEKVIGQVDQAIDLLDDQSEDRVCQTVKGGDTAQFMYYSNGKCVDDGSSPGDIAAQTRFTSGVVATCSPRDSSVDSCDSESREGEECVWSITAPECRCSTNNGGCEHHCNSNAAGFMTECSCKDGYRLNDDGRTCDDVNECADETHTCDNDQGSCHNTAGGFACSCGRGLELNADGHTCDAVDECAVDNGHCEHQCQNTAGGYSCSCNPGYTLNNSSAGHALLCDDIDECNCANPTHNCDSDHGSCHNTAGGFTCACNRGFVLNSDGHRCDDINECLVNNGNCEHTCQNTVGGYSCSCKPGYQLNSSPASHGFLCDDINECHPSHPQDPTHNCDAARGSCHNTAGGFKCSCSRGFRLNADKRTCDDIDECLVSNGNCKDTCENTLGGHRCTNGATRSPTQVPTDTPTEVPTNAPTEEPTEAPSEAPTPPACSVITSPGCDGDDCATSVTCSPGEYVQSCSSTPRHGGDGVSVSSTSCTAHSFPGSTQTPEATCCAKPTTTVVSHSIFLDSQVVSAACPAQTKAIHCTCHSRWAVCGITEFGPSGNACSRHIPTTPAGRRRGTEYGAGVKIYAICQDQLSGGDD